MVVYLHQATATIKGTDTIDHGDPGISVFTGLHAMLRVAGYRQTGAVLQLEHGRYSMFFEREDSMLGDPVPNLPGTWAVVPIP